MNSFTLLCSRARRSRVALTIAAVTVAAATLAGCSATTGEQHPDGLLVARDGALRSLDTDCSGAGTLLFMHAGATVQALDDSGEVVLSEKLPPGTPVRTDSKDYGDAPRVPTLCSFTFNASALEDGVTYSFLVDDKSIGDYVFQRDDNGVGAVEYPRLGDPSSLINSEGDQ